MKGTIKRILYEKNFGFLSVEDEEKDIFFHRSGVKEDFNDLRDGEEVEFDIEDKDRGPQATNIVKV